VRRVSSDSGSWAQKESLAHHPRVDSRPELALQIGSVWADGDVHGTAQRGMLLFHRSEEAREGNQGQNPDE
jgi:hypothetical protein